MAAASPQQGLPTAPSPELGFKTRRDKSFLAKALSLSVLVGALLTSCSAVGLYVFIQAQYFTDPGPYAYQAWFGYDKLTFVGLVFFTLAYGVGYAFLYVGLQMLAKVRPSSATIATFGLFGLGTMAVGALGFVWGFETLKCLGFLCIGTSRFVEIPNQRPEAGLGWKSQVGMSAFFCLVPAGLVTVLSSMKLLKQKGLMDGSLESVSNKPALALKERHWVVSLIQTLSILGLLVFFAFCTFYIPNSFEYFVAARIAKNAALVATQNATLCSTQWQVFTCPEVGWATFHTQNLRLSQSLVLKLYPSNLIFHIFLTAVVLFAFGLRSARGGRLVLKRTVQLPFLGTSGIFTVGELLMLTGITGMVTAFFYYWAHDHNYVGSWQGGDSPGIATSERWARSFGQLAVVFMSLLFFPASRHSLLHEFLGSSWEASIWIHRWLGYGMLAAATAHMISWYVRYDEVGLFPRDVFEVPMSLPQGIDNFTVPLSTLTTWMLLVCMGLFALAPIRRKCFELFYYAHLYAASLAVPVVMYHAAASWEYLLPGLTVWLLDRLLRLHRSGDAVQVLSVRVFGEVTEINFLKPSMTVQPGQYVFVNIPEVSVLEWHPFTISSSAESASFSMHIKSMGPGTWTGKLNKLVALRPDVDALTLSVDGPYGTPLLFADFSRVVLIAGGIGVTPCNSIFNSLKGRLQVDLLWSVREVGLVSAFLPALAVPSSSECPATAKVFMTRTATTPAVPSGVQLTLGRPNLEKELGQIDEETEADEVMVFVCGPESLVEDASNAARKFGFHFHRETFLL